MVILGLCVYAGIVFFAKKQDLFIVKDESKNTPEDHKVALSPQPILPTKQHQGVDSKPSIKEQAPTPTTPPQPVIEETPKALVAKEKPKNYLYAKYRINIRQAPSSESRVISRANIGEALEMLESYESWSKVRNRLGTEGYVASYLLQEETTQDGDNLYRVLPSSLNVRLRASAQSPAIGQLAQNTRVAVLSLTDEWAKIKLPNGQLGYISTQHIVKIN